VLSALLLDTACPVVLGAAASKSAGVVVVTEGEVHLALRSHRAPGEVGFPLELWCMADGAWAPALARLYTAMFQLQRTSCQRFTLGRIMPLHKGGPMCQASTYRPITLLNSDFKVLAHVLAERFGKVMPDCIGVEQRAYLPGRDIGDGVFHTQLVQRTCPCWGSVGPWSCWTSSRLLAPLNTFSPSHCKALWWMSGHAPADSSTASAHASFHGRPQ
jgi:hypothetical protein